MASKLTLATIKPKISAHLPPCLTPDIQGRSPGAANGCNSTQLYDKSHYCAQPWEHDAGSALGHHVANNVAAFNTDDHMRVPLLHEVDTLSKCAQNPPIAFDSGQTQHQRKQVSNVRRAPKASTITERSWKPCEARMRELYVRQKKSLKELQRIINKEFHLAATERQFKVQLQRMGLERNVKAKEQKAVVEHVIRRQRAGKESGLVRVRGHKVDRQKLSRWARDRQLAMEALSDQVIRSPSPLPSCISIHTGSLCESQSIVSPAISGSQDLRNVCSSQTYYENAVLQRLLSYSSKLGHTITARETRDVFNDIQRILSDNWVAWGLKLLEDTVPPVLVSKVKEDVLRLRNLMNSTETPTIQTENCTPFASTQSGSSRLVRMTNRSLIPHCSMQRQYCWNTRYGRIFVSVQTSNDSGVPISNAEMMYKDFHARVTIVPPKVDTFSSCVIFDVASSADFPTLSASLTYHPMVPNTSKVFELVRKGQVNKLRESFRDGEASLYDRDEQGRSLLAYALQYLQEGMCKLLLENHADVNSIEVDFCGFTWPVYAFQPCLPCEGKQHERDMIDSLLARTLEEGADITLEGDAGNGVTFVFEFLLPLQSSVSLKRFINFWSGIVIFDDSLLLTNLSPLIYIAPFSGYQAGESFQILQKAMILLEQGLDIACRDAYGNTVLHTVLACSRWCDTVSMARAYELKELWSFKLSVFTPKDMLILFMSAGADVFATNRFGQTPSDIAIKYGRTTEWKEALNYCGYDTEEIKSHCHQNFNGCMSRHPVCRLTFEDCCQQLRARNLPPEGRGHDHLWEKVDTCLYVGPRLCSYCNRFEEREPEDESETEQHTQDISLRNTSELDSPIPLVRPEEAYLQPTDGEAVNVHESVNEAFDEYPFHDGDPFFIEASQALFSIGNDGDSQALGIDYSNLGSTSDDTDMVDFFDVDAYYNHIS